jgi:hypothetical protein
MGPMPVNILTTFRHLRALNLSGNHIDNITLQVINPAANLEVGDQSIIDNIILPPTFMSRFTLPLSDAGFVSQPIERHRGALCEEIDENKGRENGK